MSWIPDKPDSRDLIYSAPEDAIDPPYSHDLRPVLPWAWSQGATSSCAGYAFAAAFSALCSKHSRPVYDPSKFYPYFFGRFIDGIHGVDKGSSIRSVIKAAARYGDCHDWQWPSDSSKICEMPSDEARDAGKKKKVLAYRRLRTSVSDVKRCVAEGRPVIFGTVLGKESIDDARRTGVYEIPRAGCNTSGRHAMVVVGYEGDDLIIRNSWGSQWGDNGHCRTHASLLLLPWLTGDLWIIDSVSDR